MQEVTLLDAYARPVQREMLREEQAAPTLAGIRNIYSVTHPSVGLTPEKLVSILRQAEFGDPWYYLELAEEMEEKDLHYRSVIDTRKMAVSMLEISIEAASDSADDQYDADFLRDVLLRSDLDFVSALTDILDAIGKGFSATEIIWNTEGRDLRTGLPQWIPERLEWRDPRWFQFDWVSGQQMLVRTLKSQDLSSLAIPATRVDASLGHQIGIQPATAPLIPFKFIQHIAKAKSGLPIRGGLARLCAWVYLFKNYVLKDWVTFAEIYGQPLRVGKYGPGATEQDKTALLRAVTNIGTDAAAIIPQSMLIEFVENKTQASSEKLYEQLCEYIDKQVSKGVLGQTLSTELPRGAGSKAATEVHDAVRRDIATDDARKLSATINRDLVKPLVDLNRGPRPMGHYPRVKFEFEEEEDLKLLSDALGPFIDRGLPVSAKEIQDKFGLRDVEEGERTLHPVEKITAQEGGSPAPDGSSFGTSNEGGKQEPAAPASRQVRASRLEDENAEDPTDAIGRFVRKLREEESNEAMAPIIKPILAKMNAAKSYPEMKRVIVDAVREMDHGPIVDLLARAGFNVNIAGRAGVKPKKMAERR